MIMKIPFKTRLTIIVLVFLISPWQAFAALTYVGGVVGSRAGSTSVGQTLSLTALTGGSGSSAVEGDIVIVACSTGSTVDRALSVTTAGYTELNELYSNGSGADTNFSVNWKIMVGTPDTSVVCGPSGSTADALSAAAQVWRGVDPVTMFDVASTSVTDTGTGRPTPPAITPTTAGTIIIPIGAGAIVGTGAVYTTGTLSNFITTTGADTNDSMLGMGSFAWVSGTYTPAQFGGGTTGTGDSWTGLTLALRPAIPPTVTTQNATSIGQTSATFNGNITAIGSGSPSERGFAWGTSSDMTGDTATTSDTVGAPFGTGAFTDSAQTLTCNTTYYYRPYAVNSAGTSTAPISNSFITSACPVSAPTVNTNAATNVSVSGATLNGNITATGGENSSARGFAWGTNSSLSGGDTSTTTESGSFGTGVFTQSAINLTANVTYYFRAYATNSQETGYGSILNFTTGTDASQSRTLRIFGGFMIKFLNGKLILYKKQ